MPKIQCPPETSVRCLFVCCLLTSSSCETKQFLTTETENRNKLKKISIIHKIILSQSRLCNKNCTQYSPRLWKILSTEIRLVKLLWPNSTMLLIEQEASVTPYRGTQLKKIFWHYSKVHLVYLSIPPSPVRGRHKNIEDSIIRGWGIAYIRFQCNALFPRHPLSYQLYSNSGAKECSSCESMEICCACVIHFYRNTLHWPTHLFQSLFFMYI